MLNDGHLSSEVLQDVLQCDHRMSQGLCQPASYANRHAKRLLKINKNSVDFNISYPQKVTFWSYTS